MSNVLTPLEEKIVVPIKEALEPREFFKTRSGLWVSDSFVERILEKAKTFTGELPVLVSYVTGNSATDKQIEAELPEKHIFSEDEVCAIVAALIEAQPKGEEGTLLNDGWWNLFYTPDFVVGVYWGSDGDGWSVSAWRLDDYRWDGEHRVFSPAN